MTPAPARARRRKTARSTSSALSRTDCASASPSALRSSVTSAMPARDRAARRRQADRLTVQQHLAAVNGSAPKIARSQLGAARALQPGDADDLAGAHRRGRSR